MRITLFVFNTAYIDLGMMSLFFSKEGKHIICGGTTSSIAAKHLGDNELYEHWNFKKDSASLISRLLFEEGIVKVNNGLCELLFIDKAK